MATPTSLPASFTAGDVLTAANMNLLRGAFRILQVVSTIKTDTFTTSSTSYTDITGLSVSITPTDANSKVLVIATLNGAGQAAVAEAFIQLVRDSTPIAIGDTAGTRIRATTTFMSDATRQVLAGVTYLDSPATTSATTYKLQIQASAAGTVYVNRAGSDTDATTRSRTVSSITVCEVSA